MKASNEADGSFPDSSQLSEGRFRNVHISDVRFRGKFNLLVEDAVRHLVIFVLSSIALLSPIQTHAWGKTGHETVGYIAASLIAGTNADKEVKKLLNTGETMATAAEWPDCAKGFRYCHKDPTPEMKDFADRNPKHHSYHYTDVSFQIAEYSEDEIGANPDDVVHILGDAILVLKGESPSNPAHNITKREALFILAHMVGDIHQPLHVGAAYVDSGDQFVVPESTQEAKDEFTQGGNLLCHGSKGVHSFWDDSLVTKAMKQAKVTTSKDFAAALLPQAKKVKADTGQIGTWPTKWATESLNLSEQELSLLVVTDRRKAGANSPCQSSRLSDNGDMIWVVEFPSDYPQDGAAIAREQLTKAGARLARLLRKIWP